MNQNLMTVTQKTRRSPLRARLRFSPTAWAKLLFLRDLGDTEIGGFGITQTDDPLFVTDFCLVQQNCSSVSVKFEDAAVADFFDQQVDQGLQPAQFARIWIHTHPGRCPLPSITDEETFERVFGATEWAVMFIFARGGQRYCRLQFNVGPGGELDIPVRVDFSCPFAASDSAAWEAEYLANVKVNTPSWLLSEYEPLQSAKNPELLPSAPGTSSDLTTSLESNHPFFAEEHWYEFWN